MEMYILITFLSTNILTGGTQTPEMELIFVDKNKDEVEETCQCQPNDIEKYLKINDFTYKKIKIEDSDTLNDEQIYFGCAVNFNFLSSADGYIIYIPGQGKFYHELFDIFKLSNIPDDTLVIINRRGKQ